MEWNGTTEKDRRAAPHCVRCTPLWRKFLSYCRERGNKVSPDQFIDHYTANGWIQGRGKTIKDWRAAVRTWERNNFGSSGKAHESGKDIFEGVNFDENS